MEILFCFIFVTFVDSKGSRHGPTKLTNINTQLQAIPSNISTNFQTKSTNSFNTTDPYEILAPFEEDFTPETFAFFNVSKKPEKFNLTTLNHLTRRWALWWYYLFFVNHVYYEDWARRTCFLMCWTYLSAIQEIRKYYGLRYFYVDHVEYEIGYQTYDIINRYQMMIEIYQIVHAKYYSQPWRYIAHTNYMFYMYRNMLEYSITIIQLCNMMHETEKKYEGKKPGLWDDYPTDEQKSNKTKKKLKDEGYVKDYLKRRQDEMKRRRRQRKKERKLINIDNYELTTPRRRPKKSFWPLHYGWSIEYW